MAIPPTRTGSIQDMQGRLDRLREAANESARSFRTAYAFYLIVALYILVIVSSTHQELLFREGDVQMPIVNVGVPVVWFFTVVPWLLVLLHFNLLVQAIFLANKVSQYAAALEGRVRSRNERSEALGLLYPAPLAHKVADADQRGEHEKAAQRYRFCHSGRAAARHSDLCSGSISPLSKRMVHLVTPCRRSHRYRPPVVALASYCRASYGMA